MMMISVDTRKEAYLNVKKVIVCGRASTASRTVTGNGWEVDGTVEIENETLAP